MASKYKALTISGNTQVSVQPMVLHGFWVSGVSGTNPTLTFYDSNQASSSDPVVLPTFTPQATPQFIDSTNGIYLKNGLYIVPGGTTPSVSITLLFE